MNGNVLKCARTILHIQIFTSTNDITLHTHSHTNIKQAQVYSSNLCCLPIWSIIDKFPHSRQATVSNLISGRHGSGTSSTRPPHLLLTAPHLTQLAGICPAAGTPSIRCLSNLALVLPYQEHLMNLEMISQHRKGRSEIWGECGRGGWVTSARLTEGFVYTLKNNWRVQNQRCHGLYCSL